MAARRGWARVNPRGANGCTTREKEEEEGIEGEPMAATLEKGGDKMDTTPKGQNPIPKLNSYSTLLRCLLNRLT